MQALSKFIIQELCVSLFCIIVLALKEVVSTNNYTHSSSFMLTMLVPNNPTGYSPVCQVQLQFMQQFLCLFSKMSRICMTKRCQSTDSSVKLVQITSTAYLEGPCKLHGNKLEIQNSLRGCLEHFPGNAGQFCSLSSSLQWWYKSQLNFQPIPWAQLYS